MSRHETATVAARRELLAGTREIGRRSGKLGAVLRGRAQRGIEAPRAGFAGIVQEVEARGRGIRTLLGVVAASVALAPAAVGARVIGAAVRASVARDDARALLRELGIGEVPRRVTPLGGGRSNAVYRVELATRTLVVKRALPEGTVLALGARLAGPQPYARDVSGAARIAREARALWRLAAAGIRVPRLVAASRTALAMEYIDGTPLPAVLARGPAPALIQSYARALAAAHAAGVALVDAHPGNALVTPAGEIVLIDLEFARTCTELGAAFAATCAFDLAYSAQYFTPDERTHLESSDVSSLSAYDLLFTWERRRQRRSAK